MAKKKRKKRGKTTKKPNRLSTIVGIASLLFISTIIVTFIVVDHRTQRILKARGTSSDYGVYADARIIKPGQRIRPELLRSELLRRAYREISDENLQPGEFRESTNGFQIYTRKFIAPTGGVIPPQLATYRHETGEILPLKGSNPKRIALEPQAIADLSSGDIRASRFVPLEKIPKTLQNAVIAIEDERFYRHSGIDLIGIARAALINISALAWVQGGSTLTQQLAKNVFLNPRRTLTRKFLEVFTAFSLERSLSKEEILEFYLNEVYLGQEGSVAIHGMAEAARSFFDKDLSQLTLAESALLAGVIRAPSSYSPRRHANRAIKRRNTVLARMLELSFINQAEFERARVERITLSTRDGARRQAPHFTAAIRKLLATDHNLDPSAIPALRIYTGLDLELQRCAERAVKSGLEELERRNRGLERRTRKLEGALVALEPFSGKVRAWAGGRDYGLNQFDHVQLAKRPIGSTIKPFVYLAALDSSLNRYKTATAASILGDEPITIKTAGADDWSPQNYDRKFRGDVTLRYALENSLNLPTVYLAQRIGINSVAQTIQRFHLSKSIPAVPSLVLGTAETSLLDLVASYGALANGGVYVKPRPFISVADSDGDIVATTQVSEERVAAEGPVYVLTNILQGVIERGTATRVRSLGFKGDVAGKTGTTDEARDAWFIGFTPDLVAGVWVGFDDNKRVGLTGGAAAVPIWTDFMKCASDFSDPLPFIPPPSVTVASIDSGSGKLASTECPEGDRVEEVFVKGTEPIELCPLHTVPGYDSNPVQPDNLPSNAPRREKGLWESLFG